MRADEHVRQRPQWVVGGQGLRVGHVECRADPPGGALLQQGVGVDDRAARGVDEQRAVRHGGQELGVDEAAGVRVSGTSRTTTSACGSSSGSRSTGCTPSRADRATSVMSTSNGASRAASADPIEPAPTISTRLPASSSVGVKAQRRVGLRAGERREVPHAREHRGGRPLGRRGVVDAARVAEGDRRWQLAHPHVGAGRHELHDPQGRHPLRQAHDLPGREERGVPELHGRRVRRRVGVAAGVDLDRPPRAERRR